MNSDHPDNPQCASMCWTHLMYVAHVIYGAHVKHLTHKVYLTPRRGGSSSSAMLSHLNIYIACLSSIALLMSTNSIYF